MWNLDIILTSQNPDGQNPDMIKLPTTKKPDMVKMQEIQNPDKPELFAGVD